jgi:hypothetical protein
VYRRASLAFFVYGFAKSGRENISDLEERSLKKLATHLLATTSEQQTAMIRAGEIEEVAGED